MRHINVSEDEIDDLETDHMKDAIGFGESDPKDMDGEPMLLGLMMGMVKTLSLLKRQDPSRNI